MKPEQAQRLHGLAAWRQAQRYVDHDDGRDEGIPGAPCACEAEHGDCPMHVRCDEGCQALRRPVTRDEWRQTAIHFRDHAMTGGCSHGW